MRRLPAVRAPLVAMVCAVVVPLSAAAQTTKLRVVGPGGEPVPFAWVAIKGEANIANEKGEIVLGSGKHKTYDLEVRRIGYQPWTGKFESPDTAAVLTVTLPRISQELAPVTVTGSAAKSVLETVGFYQRWLQHQQGGLRNATFIGPEMIDKRKPVTTMDMLDHVLGVYLVENSKGARAPTTTGERPSGLAQADRQDRAGRGSGYGSGYGSSTSGGSNMNLPPGVSSQNICYMSVLVDGGPICPSVGCHYTHAGDPPGSTSDEHIIELDKVLDVKNVAAIEVYPARDGMPPDVLKLYNGCGVILIWTGSR